MRLLPVECMELRFGVPWADPLSSPPPGLADPRAGLVVEEVGFDMMAISSMVLRFPLCLLIWMRVSDGQIN